MRKKALPQASASEYRKLKSKWQIALRRYVVDQKTCLEYAAYFGLPIYLFREWIEMQFNHGLSWENFATEWQFDHIIPTIYFDLGDKNDLLLCWNFINIRVEKIKQDESNSHRVDTLGAKEYFRDILKKGGYYLCNEMIRKIESIERTQIANNPTLELFIRNNSETINELQGFEQGDFERINAGASVKDVLMENKLLAKFAK